MDFRIKPEMGKSIDNNVVIIHNRCHVMMYGEGSFWSTNIADFASVFYGSLCCLELMLFFSYQDCDFILYCSL